MAEQDNLLGPGVIGPGDFPGIQPIDSTSSGKRRPKVSEMTFENRGGYGALPSGFEKVGVDAYQAGYFNPYYQTLDASGVDVDVIDDPDKEEEEEVVDITALTQPRDEDDVPFLPGSNLGPRQYSLTGGVRDKPFSFETANLGGQMYSYFAGIDGKPDMSGNYFGTVRDSLAGSFDLRTPGQAPTVPDPLDPSKTVATGLPPALATGLPQPLGALAAIGGGIAASRQKADVAFIVANGGMNNGGFAGKINGFNITRRPGSSGYTGQTSGLDIRQLQNLELISQGFIPGAWQKETKDDDGSFSRNFGDKDIISTEHWKNGGIGMDIRGNWVNAYGQRGSYRNQKKQDYFNAIDSKLGVNYGADWYNSKLDEYRNSSNVRRGLFGTKVVGQTFQQFIRGEVKSKQALDKAIRDAERTAAAQAAAAAAEAARQREEQAQADMRQRQEEAGAAADAAARDRDEEGGPSGNEYGFDSGQSFGVGSSGGFSGALATGGRVGLAAGGMPSEEPMGFVERPPSQVSEAATVADDKPMSVKKGTFVINAPAVEKMGEADVAKMLREAYAIAGDRGFDVPSDEEVDIAVSRGEVVIPPRIAKIIGYDRLEKINNRGKKEVDERIEENGQPRALAASGGFIGKAAGGLPSEPGPEREFVTSPAAKAALPQELPEPLPEERKASDRAADAELIEYAKSIDVPNIVGLKPEELAVLIMKGEGTYDLKNPYIFTEKVITPAEHAKGKKASSAFGPFQITYTTIENLEEKGFFKGAPSSFRTYLASLVRDGKEKVNREYGNPTEFSKKIPEFGARGKGMIPREIHEKFMPVLNKIYLTSLIDEEARVQQKHGLTGIEAIMKAHHSPNESLKFKEWQTFSKRYKKGFSIIREGSYFEEVGGKGLATPPVKAKPPKLSAEEGFMAPEKTREVTEEAKSRGIVQIPEEFGMKSPTELDMPVPDMPTPRSPTIMRQTTPDRRQMSRGGNTQPRRIMMNGVQMILR
jgi:hypothetical protein